MHDRTLKRLDGAFRVATVAIIMISIGMAVLWLFLRQKLDLEPALALLGVLEPAVPLLGRWVVRRFDTKLERERLTMPYALAYGYLNNYLAPVVRRLKRDCEHPDELRFCVYVPRSLDELRGEGIEDLLAELGRRSYTIDMVKLDFSGETRLRDVRTARRTVDASGDGRTTYFDLPTTLLTLEPAVDFKLETHEGSLPGLERERIASDYIADFHSQLRQMLQAVRFEAIRDNICVVSGGAGFLEECETCERGEEHGEMATGGTQGRKPAS